MVVSIPKDISNIKKPICSSLKTFLKENEDKAYTVGEIKEELNLTEEEAEYLERNISAWLDGSEIDCSISEGEKHFFFPYVNK